MHIVTELPKLRDVHAQSAADIQDALGAQLDILSNEGQPTILAAPPDVTGMAKSNRLGCRGSCQLWRSLANFARRAQAPPEQAVTIRTLCCALVVLPVTAFGT